MTSTAANTYKCPKCNGGGYLSCYAGIAGGICFSCEGRGFKFGKAPVPGVKWAVFGIDRNTGERARLYNVTAKTDTAAVAKAQATYVGASDAFKDQYSLATAVAVKWSELETAA